MKQNLNDIKGRIAAAKMGEWQNSLADRWRYYFGVDLIGTHDAQCPICSNAP